MKRSHLWIVYGGILILILAGGVVWNCFLRSPSIVTAERIPGDDSVLVIKLSGSPLIVGSFASYKPVYVASGSAKWEPHSAQSKNGIINGSASIAVRVPKGAKDLTLHLGDLPPMPIRE